MVTGYAAFFGTLAVVDKARMDPWMMVCIISVVEFEKSFSALTSWPTPCSHQQANTIHNVTASTSFQHASLDNSIRRHFWMTRWC